MSSTSNRPDRPSGAGLRARVRAELTEEIKAAARRQLAEHGASDLSLRAVARELEMVSSAVYRYFSSRDELLTALIVDAYDALGAAVERAEAAVPRANLHGRWIAAGRAVRRWALAHPHEYALLYGSPVPGYAAPQDTVGPATRVARVLARILHDREAQRGRSGEDGDDVALPDAVRADLAVVRDGLGIDVPDEALQRGLMAWVHLFGTVSFELFGQYHNVISDNDAYYDLELERLAGFIRLG